MDHKLHYYHATGSYHLYVKKQIICLFGDPTLRAGDAPSILRKWGEDPKNAIVFTGKQGMDVISTFYHIIVCIM